MNDYREVRIDISPCSEDGTDLLAYHLAEAGFESFVPDEKGLTAYVKEELYDPKVLNDAIAQYPFAAALDISTKFIEGRDWNAEWEKNYFNPIVICDKCVVHSTFHENVPEADYDIIIDPKMAFGTGHHATTSLVLEALLNMDVQDKSVIDMGTGTGILAILCAYRGAHPICAVEIDSFAYKNAVENLKLNNVEDKITLINGDASALASCPKADILVANINRNIILNDLQAYTNVLNKDATMILSGFYEQDIPIIENVARQLGLETTHTSVKDSWTCLQMHFTR